MKLIYAHGLDSSKNAMKGQLLEQYCKQHHADITVTVPDLNFPPAQVLDILRGYIASSQASQNTKSDEQVVIMGSSLGGYFASLISNETGCPVVLLNPSTKPHVSLQRFVDEGSLKDASQDTVVYHTTGGWDITVADLHWFAAHQLTQVNYPQQVYAVIKRGDELLDATISAGFFQNQGATVELQAGGDHRMTDFNSQLPMIMSHIEKLS